MLDSIKPLGTSMRIFLVDGEADGIWEVEKSNWTGKALMAPRTRNASLRSRPDLDGPGVYVLVGPSESGLQASRIYVGETDDLPTRLNDHNRDKDFWNRVIVFTSKDENLNKAHVRYLETRLIELARVANRAEIENKDEGKLPPLSEPDIADVEAFLSEMLLIYPVLGVQVFQKAEEQPSSSIRLQLSGVDTKAEGTETPDGFVVFADSLGRASEVESIAPLFTRLRRTLQENGILSMDGKQLRLTENYVFSSPSTAAAVMLGRNSNGRTDWKAADGRTLKELQLAEAPEAETSDT